MTNKNKAMGRLLSLSRIALFVLINVLILSLLSFGSAQGYTTEKADGCYQPNPPFGTEICCNRTLAWRHDITLERKRISFPDGSSSTEALIKGWSRWNELADVGLGTAGSDSTTVSFGNGISEIAFVSSEFTSYPDTPALVYTDWSIDECGYTEADMYWNPNVDFHSAEDAAHLPYTDGRNLVGVAIHEFGHVIGLLHEDRWYNMMGSDSTHVNRNANNTYYGPGEDAAAGVRTLYGDINAFDLGVSIYAYNGVSGEYSQHAIRSWIGHSGTCGTRDGVNCFEVNSGDSVQVPFTLENNGSRTEEVTYTIYISGNNNITEYDQKITSFTHSLSPDQPFEDYFSITIPQGLESGSDWYLGLIVERQPGLLSPGSALDEVTMKNNAAWYPFSVIDGNDAPTAGSTTYTTTTLNTAVSIQVPAGSDPDGDSLTYSVYSTPTNGGVSSSGRTFVYTPIAGFTGTDSFTYKVSDPYGLFDSASVYITVVAADDSYEPNNFLSSAYDISSYENSWLSDISGLGKQSDEDWYKIYVNSGDTNIQAELTFTHADGDIDLVLYDPSGSFLISSRSSTNDEYIDYEVTQEGFYYLKVYYGNNGNSYNLRWNSIKQIINGACGSSNGGNFISVPNINLCSSGDNSSISGTGPWAWICYGKNGGTSAYCSAQLDTDRDDDNDGMPDYWELLNNLDPYTDDAALDADGDGASNLKEYLAGTNPNDNQSFPETVNTIVPILYLLLK